jgi:hypothetical protein
LGDEMVNRVFRAVPCIRDPFPLRSPVVQIVALMDKFCEQPKNVPKRKKPAPSRERASQGRNAHRGGSGRTVDRPDLDQPTFFTGGIVQVPSMIEGSFSFGQ